MGKFSSGPWTCDIFSNAESRTNHRANIRSSDGNRVAYAYADMLRMHKDESTANARLIAAAPDLLAACKAASRAIEENIDDEDTDDGAPTWAQALHMQLEAALAKAEGGA